MERYTYDITREREWASVIVTDLVCTLHESHFGDVGNFWW